MCRPHTLANARHPGHALPRGFTYLAVLFILAFLGGGLALTGEIWHTAVQREREAELLYVGSEYRKAIRSYFLGPRPQQPQRIYPRNLDDLLKDPRDAGTLRHLRKRYVDPMTGKSEWGIVKAPDGGIMGVYSLSEDPPLKVANFRVTDKGFDGSEKYSDWKFVFTPPQQPGATKPSAKPPAPGAPSAPGTPPPAPARKP